MLVHVLETALRLLHPFMPFVTEAVWQSLAAIWPIPERRRSSPPPIPRPSPRGGTTRRSSAPESVIDVIRAVRNISAEFGVEPARHIEAYVIADADACSPGDEPTPHRRAGTGAAAPHRLAPGDAPQEAVVTAVLKDSQVVLPMGGMFDLEAERGRLQKQIAAAETDVERLRSKLANCRNSWPRRRRRSWIRRRRNWRPLKREWPDCRSGCAKGSRRLRPPLLARREYRNVLSWKASVLGQANLSAV